MRTAIAVTAVCLSIVGVTVAESVTAAVRKSVDIPPQALDSALKSLAKQRDFQILYLANVVGESRTAGAVGEYTPIEALQQLLANTGFTYQVLDEETVSVSAAAQQVSASASAGTSASSSVSSSRSPGDGDRRGFWSRLRFAQANATSRTENESARAPAKESVSSQPEGGQQLEEILVRGRREQLSTMKGDSPILMIPQNIQVLSSALLEDMGVVFLDDALRNVAGVMPGGIYNGFDYFRIRGFASDATYLDGLRLDNFTGLNVELFGLERLEVIKGPASTLYGDLFSGMVNLVSKRPKPEAFLEVGLTGGTDSFFEPTLDFGGALNAAGTVYGRMVALYRNDGTFVDFSDGLDRYYVAPSLTWEIGPASKLTVFTTYQRDVNELTRALPAYGTVLPNPNGKIPLDRYIGDGLDPTPTTYEMSSVGYQFTHEFNSTLSFRQNARASWRTGHYENDLSPLRLDADMRTLYRYAASADFDWQIYTVDTGLDARFATGGLEHHLTTGVDYSSTSYDARSFYSNFGDPSAIPPLDLFDPVYTAIPDVPMYASPYASSTWSAGLYLNDRVQVTEQLSVTLGARFERSTGGDSYASRDSGHAFVPNVGLSYEVMPGLVVFASYAESFSPQYYLRLAGNEFPDPLRGESWEAGIKTALFDERLNMTLAAFNLERKNIAVADPSNPGFSVLTGEQRSRGVEFDSQILLTPNLQMLASYAYIDGEVLASTTVPIGSPLHNSPEHSFSLWMKYTIHGGALDGLGFSLGGSTYSSQSADFANTFELPAYTLVNANVSYRKDNFVTQLNLLNALDEEYFAGSYNTNIVLPGRPRSLRLSFIWSY